MKISDLPVALKQLRAACKTWRTPVVTQISRSGSPFRVLVSTLLSLRTRDEVTEAASSRLLTLANTPESMLRISPETIQEAIYPAAFFRNKQRSLLALCQTLVRDHGGRVPDTLDGLLALPGVGRKTANLTLILGFNKPGICVDTHVHRICNRWGLFRPGRRMKRNWFSGKFFPNVIGKNSTTCWWRSARTAVSLYHRNVVGALSRSFVANTG